MITTPPPRTSPSSGTSVTQTGYSDVALYCTTIVDTSTLELAPSIRRHCTAAKHFDEGSTLVACAASAWFSYGAAGRLSCHCASGPSVLLSRIPAGSAVILSIAACPYRFPRWCSRYTVPYLTAGVRIRPITGWRRLHRRLCLPGDDGGRRAAAWESHLCEPPLVHHTNPHNSESVSRGGSRTYSRNRTLSSNRVWYLTRSADAANLAQTSCAIARGAPRSGVSVETKDGGSFAVNARPRSQGIRGGLYGEQSEVQFTAEAKVDIHTNGPDNKESLNAARSMLREAYCEGSNDCCKPRRRSHCRREALQYPGSHSSRRGALPGG
ncbi:hypothetical protein BDV96DRAFT_600139 [Lophiotrema nucula]|uniref:Uncharacterized protein n=1 Tax=Lophiotrema nucula TaxID=690887 RepID=A0A6A5Z9C9_9PLEO|nr:hypothetical protein BDV96DRAFT_600139 [Lophiotrema nucula]